MADQGFDSDREALIHRITHILIEAGFEHHAIPPLLACLWLADIDNLKSLATESPEDLASLAAVAHSILRAWVQKAAPSSRSVSVGSSRAQSVKDSPQQSPQGPAVSKDRPEAEDPSTPPKRKREEATTSSPTSIPTPKRVRKLDSTDRSRTAVSLAKHRDNYRCVIQWIPQHDVAHIYPYSLRNIGPTSPFVLGLRKFWKAERVDEWMSSINQHGTESPSNLICLSPTAHRMHGNGCFAFEFKEAKMEGDFYTLELIFHWLKVHSPANEESLARYKLPSLELAYPSGYGLFVYSAEDANGGHHVKTGDIIKLRAPRQSELPLQPIIEMHWLLNRAAALSGAAEARDLSINYDDDDDDDDDGYGFPIPSSVTQSRLDFTSPRPPLSSEPSSFTEDEKNPREVLYDTSAVQDTSSQ